MSLEVTLISTISIVHTNPLDMTTPIEKHTQHYQLDLTNGTGPDQSDQVWHDRRSTAGTDDIDLEGGLINAYGVVLNPARVAWLLIKNTTAIGGGNAVFGGVGGATAALLGFGANTHTWAIPPGGEFKVTRPDSSGWATAAGADILRIAASAGTVTYDIWIGMKSA